VRGDLHTHRITKSALLRNGPERDFGLMLVLDPRSRSQVEGASREIGGLK
jgi:hypothetical protein